MFRRVRQTGELGAVQNSARAMAKKRSGHSPRGVLPTPTSKAKRTRAGNLAAIDRASLSVLGVRISHPDRLIYADLGIAKIQIARYYERIGDWIVPHVAGRPLTLVHCPAGIAAPCHYLKHAKAWGPSALRRVRIQERPRLASTSSRTPLRPWCRWRRWESWRFTPGTPPRTTSSVQIGGESHPACARGSAIVCVVHAARDEKGPNPVEADTTRAHSRASAPGMAGWAFLSRSDRTACSSWDSCCNPVFLRRAELNCTARA